MTRPFRQAAAQRRRHGRASAAPRVTTPAINSSTKESSERRKVAWSSRADVRKARG